MEKAKPKGRLRVFAALMAFVLAMGLAPMFAFAAEGGGSPTLVVGSTQADPIDVYVSVSNKGTLALARQSVTVTDVDADGTLTLDEAMQAAHAAHCPNGYATGPSQYGGLQVTKLWGVDTTNTTFYIKDEMTNSVDSQAVAAGDDIVASVLSDDIYSSDHYAFFDKKVATVAAGEELSLKLSAKSWTATMAASGVQVGTWANDAFTPINGKKTDSKGNVKLSFDKPGTYVVSASGTVTDDVVIDWNTYATKTMDCPLTAPVCIVTVTAAPAVSLNKAVVTLTNASSVYNGKAQKGAVKSVTLNGKQLIAGTDYEVNAASGVNVGSYAVTVTGKGSYVGTVKATFKITPASISKATVTLKSESSVYTGKAQQGAIGSLVLNGKSLKAGTDFTVSAKAGKNVGSYAVTATGKGNYTGTVQATFKITKATAKTKVVKKKAIKASKVKNKAYKFTAIKLTTDGKKTYKVVKADANNGLTFKAGKVIVKKGTKKGTYTIKVKVSAKAGKNYKKLRAKTYSIKVRVK